MRTTLPTSVSALGECNVVRRTCGIVVVEMGSCRAPPFCATRDMKGGVILVG
jgi:hypothetical protein